MNSTFLVTTPAASRALLTPAELRFATRQPATKDADLATLGGLIAGEISTHCRLADDGINQPTLRRESVQETFRSDHAALRREEFEIVLARRFVVPGSLVIVEDGVTLTADVDYVLDPAAGIVQRMYPTFEYRAWWLWGVSTIVATYDAGFVTVPDDLRGAAIDLAKLRWAQHTRDPQVSQEAMPGVYSVQYRLGDPKDDPAIPQDIADRLVRFTNL